MSHGGFNNYGFGVAIKFFERDLCMNRLKRILHIKGSKKERLDASFAKLVEEEGQDKKVETKRIFTLRFYMMILSGTIAITGLGFFVVYVLTTAIALGTSGIVMLVAGLIAFRYYWKKEENLSVEYIGGGERGGIVNSLSIYQEKVVFENVDKPEGFPWRCVGLKGTYYVNIWNVENSKLVPFILPDQQYCDPTVFAQRVLGLPAHRKIFERKPKLLQKLKTVLLVVAIGIVWLLILTTTGG